MKKNKIVREIVSTGALILGILAFRSSIAEPYRVPTGSMKPTIQPGDFLFVSKLSYDLKFPFSDWVIHHRSEPKRGDIIVFKYPVDPSINFVKRLIGLPGDRIEVLDGEIQINGEKLKLTPEENAKMLEYAKKDFASAVWKENLGDTVHTVQRVPHPPSYEPGRWLVPEGHYFFMGDNRDNSNDSRYWGFVPKEYLKGRALFVWFSADTSKSWIPEFHFDRIGNSLQN